MADPGGAAKQTKRPKAEPTKRQRPAEADSGENAKLTKVIKLPEVDNKLWSCDGNNNTCASKTPPTGSKLRMLRTAWGRCRFTGTGR